MKPPQLRRSFSLPVTEGWLELFLTPTEKETFAKWEENVTNRSLTAKHTGGFFDLIVRSLPSHLAPNAISLSGFIVLSNSWYIMVKFGTDYPNECTWCAVASIILFFVTNSIDQKHADRIRQRTALGDLVKYACDTASTVFLTMLTTYSLGGTTWATQWYAVQSSQVSNHYYTN